MSREKVYKYRLLCVISALFTVQSFPKWQNNKRHSITTNFRAHALYQVEITRNVTNRLPYWRTGTKTFQNGSYIYDDFLSECYKNFMSNNFVNKHWPQSLKGHRHDWWSLFTFSFCPKFYTSAEWSYCKQNDHFRTHCAWNRDTCGIWRKRK